MTDEPNQQPLQPQTPSRFSGFGGLEGIEPPKDVQARPSSALEKLLQIGEEVVKEYAPKKPILMDGSDVCDFYENDKYAQFYDDIKKQLSDISFNEKDLEDLVMAGLNADFGASIDLSAYEYLVRGMYTGCLAHLLTERNRTKGKRTKIHIDGRGNVFHFLFLFARDVDDIIVENLKGSWICGYVASHNGHANDIIGVNLKGNSPLAYIGSNKGKVKRLVGLSLDGSKIMYNAFSEGGNCSQIIGAHIRGEFENMCHIGSSSRGNIGLIEQLIIVDIEGCKISVFGVGSQGSKFNQVIVVKANSWGKADTASTGDVLGGISRSSEILQVIGADIISYNAFVNACISDGYVHQLYGINIEGDRAFSNLGYYYGRLGTIAAINVKGKEAFHWHSDQKELKNGPQTKNVGKIILYDCNDVSPFINAYSDNIVSGDEALAEYKILSKKHHIQEIIDLVKSMQGKTYHDVLDIADKLYLLQPDFTCDVSLHQKHAEDKLRRARGLFWGLYFDAKYYLKDKLQNFRDYLLEKTNDEKDSDGK